MKTAIDARASMAVFLYLFDRWQNVAWRQFVTKPSLCYILTDVASSGDNQSIGIVMSALVEKERITARISTAVAEVLNSAAELTGTTLNGFVVQAALEKAQKIVDREKRITISQEDAAMLLNLLDNPPTPNDAMKRGFQRFMEQKYGDRNY